MGIDCCKLVGNLDLGLADCIISVSTNCNTEIINACVDELLEGPSTFTVNITGYASDNIWVNCAGKAGVSISYLTKYDCVEDEVHLIPVGKGQSFKVGPVDSYVDLLSELPTSCVSISASSSSGPASIYMESVQINGYGLSYSGNPISFNTDEVNNLFFDLGGKLGSDFVLNSFSFEAQPGQLPTASYTFIRPL